MTTQEHKSYVDKLIVKSTRQHNKELLHDLMYSVTMGILILLTTI